MKVNFRFFIGLVVLIASLFASIKPASAQVNVTTERYDNARTGANLNETFLTTTNVDSDEFGKLWSYTVSGSIHAQPLYVANVAIPGQGTHNVLFIVTMNDIIYAFDADSSSNSPLWSLDITSQVAGSKPVRVTDIASGIDIIGNVGIESTPQIDLSTNTMYLVARTKEAGSACGAINGNYCQRLHALDIATGNEKFGGPVIIRGSVPGTGSPSVGGTLTFDPLIENQRTSLALANGQIFIAWASHEDQNLYHGWVMSYSASTLAQSGIWSDSPDGAMGGIWMSGRAPAVDATGNVYYTIGNGDWDGTRNFGESMVKFSSTPALTLLDWFTPASWSSLNGGDTDYGASGPILIPGSDLITSAGKSSTFYVMHTGNLGHEHLGNTQIVQSLNINGGEIHGGPVYWNRSGGVGPWMYIWSANGDFIKAYHFNGTSFDSNPVSEGTITAANGPPSNGTLTLSANGSTPGSGIIWSSMPASNNGAGVLPGVLRAINADDLTKELWNSSLNAARDDMGNYPKGSPPTVVNGRVYMGSFPADGVGNTAVNVYGMLPIPTPDFTIAVSPTNQSAMPAGNAVYTVSTTSLFNFADTVNFSVTGLPSGATATFSPTSLTPPGSSTLTVATTAGTPVGSYILTITGTSGSITHSVTANLVISTFNPGFGAIGIDFVGGAQDLAQTDVVGVVRKSNWNNAHFASGNIGLFDETGTSTGASATWNSSNYFSTVIAETPGDFRMMKGYIDPQGQSGTVTVAGLPSDPAGYDVYVYADGSNGGTTRTGAYQISGTGITTTSINLTDAASTDFSGTYIQANNSSGNYVKFTIIATGFTITATPGLSTDGAKRAPVNGIQIVPHSSSTPDFTISASPASQSVSPGNSTSYTVTVGALNGFAGVVTLSASGLPTPGAAATFNPTTITGSGTSTMTVTTTSSTPAGTSTLTITGTSGNLAHTKSVNLAVTNTAPGAGTISIDFVGMSPAAMAPSEIAGVVPEANWNGAAGASGSGLALVDETGTAIGATVTWNSNSIFNVPIADTPGNFRMMNGNLDPSGQNATVTVTGLPSNSAGYDVYVYADGANSAATRNSTYQISGTGITTTSINLIDAPNTNFSGTFTQANNSNGNFVLFPITATGFTITSIPGSGSDGTKRAPINGIQIVPHASSSADFSIAVTPASQTVNPGNSTTYTVTVAAQNGFAGVVTLSASGLPTPGATATFNPTTITGSGTSTMTVTTSGSTPTGTSTLTTTGVSGSLTHTATSTLVVSAAADFSIAVTPASQTVNPGNSTSYTVTVGALNGFAGVVTLSASGLPTPGATATFNPTTITGSGTSTMTVTTSGSTPTGTSTLTTTGVSGSLTHTATSTLVVSAAADFSIAVTPASQTVSPGNSTTYTVTVAAQNGFAGVVTLSASGLPTPGATATFNPTTITGSGTSTMTVTTSGSTPTGTSTLTTTGTSGSLTHTATSTLVVSAAADFSIAVTPASQTVNPGNSTSYTVTVAAQNGFAGVVTLSASGLPTPGATATFNPTTITGSGTSTMTVTTSGSTPTGTSTLTITGTSGSLTHSTTVNLVVMSASQTPNAISIDFVGMSAAAMAPSEIAGVVPEANWNDAAGASGSGLALVDQTGTATGATATWNSNNIFHLPTADTAGNLRMMNGYLDPSGQNATVTVAGLPSNSAGYDVYVYADGSNGSATRNSTYQISGAGVTTTSIGLTDAPNTNFSGTFTQANNSNGNFILFPITATGFTITSIPGSGSDGTKRAPINGIQIVPHASSMADFSIAVTPASQTVNPGNSTTYTVTVAAQNGFAGVVTLSASGLPTPGATATFNPTTITGSGTSTMTVTTSGSTPTGTSTLTTTGVSGSLTHTATSTLVVSAAADFSIAVTPASQTVNPGNSTTYTVTVAAQNGFAGVVTLSASGLPTPGATATFNPTTITGSGTSTMTVTTSGSTPTGTSTLTTTGVSGSLTHTATSTLVVSAAADFSIAVTPASQTVNPGNSTTYTVTVGALNGFAGVVTLSASGLPTPGATATFNPTTITGSGTSTMTVTTSGSTPTGTSTLTTTGTSGSLTHTATNTLVVSAAADFSIAVTPASQTVNPGNSTTYTVTVAAQNGFAGVVTLSASGLPTPGATATFNPTTITGSGTSTMTVTTSGSTPTGTSTLTTTGVSGSLTHTATSTLVVSAAADFSIAVTPASQTVNPGNSTTYTVTVGALNGFAGVVTLSASGLPTPGATATFNPTTITGSGTSTMTVTTSGSTPTGTSTLTTTGTSGSLTHTATNTLVVSAAADFSIAVTPASQTVNPGNSTTYTVTVAAQNGFAGVVTLSASGLPTPGATATFNPTTITGGGTSTMTVTTSGSTPTGTSTLTTTGTSGSLTHTATNTLVVSAAADFSIAVTPASQTVNPGNSTTYTVTVAAQNGFAGVVTLSASGLPTPGATATFNPTTITGSGTSTMTVTTSGSTPTGTSTLTTTGVSGSLTHTATSTLVVSAAADFSIAVTPASQTVNPGNSTSYTVTVAAQNGFAGVVTLSASGLPTPGATATFNPTTITGSGTSTMTVTTSGSTPTGTSTLTTTGVSGSLTHTATSTLVVSAAADFSIAVTPASQTVSPGNSTTYTVTVAAQNGFAGVVTLSASGLPTPGATATFNPTTITGSGTSTMTVTTSGSTPTGTSTLTTTGTSGSLTHTATSTLVVSAAADFSIAVTPASQTVNPGNSTSYTVTVGALNGFAGVVTLSASGLPTPGATATFNPTTITGSGTSTMTVTTSGSTPTGTSTLTTTGVSGSLTHTATSTLVVSAAADFSIAVTPASQTVNPGNSTSYTVTVGALNGFAGVVTLSASGLPTPGATATFNPTTITGSGTSTMTVTTSGSTPTGTSTLTTTGVSGSLTHTATSTLVVSAAADFSIAVTPASQTVNPGNSTTYTVTVGALNGFAGVVTLSASGLPTPGATATFNPTTITGSGTSTMTVTTGGSTPTGTSTLTTTGTSGSLTHTATSTLVVSAAADFSIAVTPASQTVNPGNSTTYTVTVGALNGFAGVVTLSASGLPTPGATATFNPTTITGSGTSTMTVTTSGSTPTGTSTLTTTGVSGSLTHTATSTLVVSAAADFSIAVTPASQTVNPGNSTTYTVTVGALNGFAGVVTLGASGLPTPGATATFNPTTITGSGTSTMTVTTSGSTPTGTSTLTTTGVSGSLTHTATSTLVVSAAADFSIAVTPASQTVNPGNSTSYTVTVGALNGFAGVVTLSASGLPTPGATATFNPTTITGSGTSTMTVTTSGSTPTGTSTLTTTGTSGSLTHTATSTLVVSAAADFSIAVTPASQTVNPGNSTTYTVTVGALNGFAGVVTLSASGLPTPGATATFNPTTITGSGTSTMTVTTSGSTPTGTSTLTTTGTSGSLTHSTTVSLVVMSASQTPNAISIDFVGTDVPMASTEVAGIVPKSNWNEATGTNGSGMTLVDETGTTTAASLAWASTSMTRLQISDTPGNFRMMKGYLDPKGQNAVITVTGLPASSTGYDIYIYADGQTGNATRNSTYQISGAGITTTSINLIDASNANFNGVYTQANNSNGNFVKFTIAATSFTINAIPGTSSDGTQRAPVNGIQIIPH